MPKGCGVEVLTISNKELQINEEIRDKEIRVVGDDGAQLGIMSAKDALKIASEKNLDLVKIAPQAVPPVCRIMDYGKYRFEKAKREKEARKNQKTIDTKEVRLSLNIDVHDIDIQGQQATSFGRAEIRSRYRYRFRGREMAHPELGQTLIMRFADACSEYGNMDKNPQDGGAQHGAVSFRKAC